MADFTRLTHVEVEALWPQREQVFAQDELDLAPNQVIDSSGIAFLVQWAKHTPNKRLTLHHASHNVRSLISTFHLEPLFVLAD